MHSGLAPTVLRDIGRSFQFGHERLDVLELSGLHRTIQHAPSRPYSDRGRRIGFYHRLEQSCGGRGSSLLQPSLPMGQYEAAARFIRGVPRKSVPDAFSAGRNRQSPGALHSGPRAIADRARAIPPYRTRRLRRWDPVSLHRGGMLR